MGAMVFPTKADGRNTRSRTTSGQVDNWAEAQLAKQLNGKAIVDIHNGEKIGQISDVLFNPNTLRVAALMISQGGLLNRDEEAFPADNVQVWGKDVVLVNRSNQMGVDRVTGVDQFVKLSDQLRGRYVVSTDGERVGQIEDVLLGDRGQLVGYELSQVFVQGPLVESKRIPVDATSSLGKDVLIVDLSKI